MKKNYTIYQVDAFTREKLAGNPRRCGAGRARADRGTDAAHRPGAE